MSVRILLLFLVITLTFYGCRKADQLSANKAFQLRLSETKVTFDTLFTTTISTLHRVTLYNDQANALEISSLRLKGSAGSVYSFSAGGKPGPLLSQLKLAGKDSIVLYIKAQIPADRRISPFVESDSILITTNGNHQGIALTSYGQNANMISDTLIQADTHWNAIYPYVLAHTLTVGPGATLRLDAGTQVYFHGLSGLHIKGTLLVNGQLGFPVTFQSDRLEPAYSTLPGQWEGITISPGSTGNTVNYATIFNAGTGIAMSGFPGQGPAVQAVITNTMIGNMSFDGIYCQNSAVRLLNDLIFYCQNSLLDVLGDSYLQAKQNTFYNSNQFFFHTLPAVNLALTGETDSVAFLNNLVFGTLTNELAITGKGHIALSGNFITASAPVSAGYPGNVFGADPKFVSPANYDFHLQGTSSPAHQKGITLAADPDFSVLSLDLDGISRKNPPTVGAYEVN